MILLQKMMRPKYIKIVENVNLIGKATHLQRQFEGYALVYSE